MALEPIFDLVIRYRDPGGNRTAHHVMQLIVSADGTLVSGDAIVREVRTIVSALTIAERSRVSEEF